MEKQKLLYQQARLHERGAAEMVLQTISASKGELRGGAASPPAPGSPRSSPLTHSVPTFLGQARVCDGTDASPPLHRAILTLVSECLLKVCFISAQEVLEILL